MNDMRKIKAMLTPLVFGARKPKSMEDGGMKNEHKTKMKLSDLIEKKTIYWSCDTVVCVAALGAREIKRETEFAGWAISNSRWMLFHYKRQPILYFTRCSKNIRRRKVK